MLRCLAVWCARITTCTCLCTMRINCKYRPHCSSSLCPLFSPRQFSVTWNQFRNLRSLLQVSKWCKMQIIVCSLHLVITGRREKGGIHTKLFSILLNSHLRWVVSQCNWILCSCPLLRSSWKVTVYFTGSSLPEEVHSPTFQVPTLQNSIIIAVKCKCFQLIHNRYSCESSSFLSVLLCRSYTVLHTGIIIQ